MAKPMKTLELHYPMILFLIIAEIKLPSLWPVEPQERFLGRGDLQISTSQRILFLTFFRMFFVSLDSDISLAPIDHSYLMKSVRSVKI